jgi:hypothetical protein
MYVALSLSYYLVIEVPKAGLELMAETDANMYATDLSCNCVDVVAKPET